MSRIGANALREALRYDSQVLVEEKIEGRETTVGILDDEPLPLVEVRPKPGIYDYPTSTPPAARNIFAPRHLMRRRPGGFRRRRSARSAQLGDVIMRAWT